MQKLSTLQLATQERIEQQGSASLRESNQYSNTETRDKEQRHSPLIVVLAMMGDMMCGNRRLSESNTADFEFDFWNSNQLDEM
jgi:hypothetical protein